MFRIRSQIPLHVMGFVSRIKGLGACKAQGPPPRDPDISISTSFTGHAATII